MWVRYRNDDQRLWLVLLACVVCIPAQASIFRTKLPVSLGAGLDHPLPLTALRGEVALADRDTDKAIVGLQGESTFHHLSADEDGAFWAALGGLLISDEDTLEESDQVINLRSGLKLGAPVVFIPGLWASTNLNVAYLSEDDDNKVDVFGNVNLRYQASGLEWGRAADLYASASIGAEGFFDAGVVVGATTALGEQRVVGAEFASTDDRFSIFLGLPYHQDQTLTIAVGTADSADIGVQLQWTRYYR
nr:hypothetical protein [Oceanococcus sp. HetDA_MAG_MS8]